MVLWQYHILLQYFAEKKTQYKIDFKYIIQNIVTKCDTDAVIKEICHTTSDPSQHTKPGLVMLVPSESGLTLKLHIHVIMSPILRHSPSNLQVLVSQRKRSVSRSSSPATTQRDRKHHEFLHKHSCVKTLFVQTLLIKIIQQNYRREHIIPAGWLAGLLKGSSSCDEQLHLPRPYFALETFSYREWNKCSWRNNDSAHGELLGIGAWEPYSAFIISWVQALWNILNLLRSWTDSET